ncbi:MAG: RNA polymerase sigma factor [Nakamurella sp.]
MTPESPHSNAFEALCRRLTPHVLGAVVRRFGHFELAEDAVQEALIAAAAQWRRDGPPDDPRAWLIAVAARRMTDLLRSEGSRRRREEDVFALRDRLVDPMATPAAEEMDGTAGADDTLTVMLMCCHPALSRASQVSLTLRAVGGLTTREIAQAFLIPETTMAQRITRARASIRDAGTTFELPLPQELPERLDALMRVIYLIFNEGYTASSGPSLQRTDLSREAIRLGRLLRLARPADGEVAGLLALMLLTNARRPARESMDGALMPLAEQDRSRWDGRAIGEGIAIMTESLRRNPIGPYQIQAAIAALHSEAACADATDWPQILALYDLLRVVQPGPMVDLSRAVAVAMTNGPRAGLLALEELPDQRARGHHRFAAVRAHLLEMDGDARGAHAEYLRAAELTVSIPERQFLITRAARVSPV